jgi:Transposase DDE domain
VDGTGLDSRHASRHYARRNKSKRFSMRRFVLLEVACHTESHLLAAAEVRVGPTNESPLFTDVIDEAARHARWDRVLADAAHDAEHNHRLCREGWRIRSTVIPLNRRGHGRKWPKTRYRRQMVKRFRKKRRGARHRRVYGQRWQVESAISRHKRLLGSALRSRSDGARERECYLRVLTHNLMLLAAVDS